MQVINRGKLLVGWGGRWWFCHSKDHVKVTCPLCASLSTCATSYGKSKATPQPSFAAVAFLLLKKFLLRQVETGLWWQMLAFPRGSRGEPPSMLLPVTDMLGARVDMWLPVGLSWTVTSPERPSLTILSKVIPHPHHPRSHPLVVCFSEHCCKAFANNTVLYGWLNTLIWMSHI